MTKVRLAVLPRGVIGALGVLLLGGCDEPALSGRASATAAPPAGRASSAIAPSICGSGNAALSTSAIKARGAPAQEARVALSEPLSEFRIKLLNHFRLPRDAAVIIRERTWVDRDCRLTVWSAQEGGMWRAVDALHWLRGDQF